MKVSPVFLCVILVTAGAGYSAYHKIYSPELSVFFFVTGGWIISLCFHEFAHALIGYWGGDTSIPGKGYLTLNPLKYTHGLLSIGLPLIYLILGGIGLPGGTVGVTLSAIRSNLMRRLTYAAGPAATAAVTLILLAPFNTNLVAVDMTRHPEFWSGVSLLAFVHLTALIFTLLPIPPLDGFGILLPTPPRILMRAMGYSSSFIFLFIFLFLITYPDSPVRKVFWIWIWSASNYVNLDPRWVVAGLKLYRFWPSPLSWL